MGSLSKGDAELPAATRALLDAVDTDDAYPDRAAFIDADAVDVGRQIAAAQEDDRAVVLCYADGTRLILRPVPPAAAA